MPNSQTLIIPGRLPGMNEYTNCNRGNRYAAAKLKKDTDSTIMWYIKSQRIQPVSVPVSISILWVEPNARRDIDNVASGKKFICDALVKSGILPNDTQKWVKQLKDEFAVDKQKPRVEVTITEWSENE